MANVLIDESILRGWADTIRAKTGSTDSMLPTVMLERTETEWGVGGGGGSSTSWNELIPSTTLPFTLYSSDPNVYAFTANMSGLITDTEKKYKVVWDGTEYKCDSKMLTMVADDGVTTYDVGYCVGNAQIFWTAMGRQDEYNEDTGEPFGLVELIGGEELIVGTFSSASTHTVELHSGTEREGSSDLVKYVTHNNWDGQELYVKPTINGDDCVDIVAKGLIPKPTKPSTNTTNFTQNGWSRTQGGSADSSALKNITEDVTVYATYSESVRYYRVRYYDSDGATLFNTVQVPYGADASEYAPKKEGYLISGWVPDVSNVTEDIDTTAVWVENSWLAKKEAPTLSAGFEALYSQDGTKLFVSSAYTLYMYDATKEPYTLIKSVSVGNVTAQTVTAMDGMTLSPDGSYIILPKYNYISSGGFSLALNLYSTLDLTNVGATFFPSSVSGWVNQRSVYSVTITPDGKELYLVGAKGNDGGSVSTEAYIAVVFDISTTPWTVLSEKSSVLTDKLITKPGTNLIWKITRDGDKLIQSSSKGIVVYDIKNNYEDITSTIISTSFKAKFIEMSNDGRYIAFSAGLLSTSGEVFCVYDTENLDVNGRYTKVLSGNFTEYGCAQGICFGNDGLFVVGHGTSPYFTAFDMNTLSKKDAHKELPDGVNTDGAVTNRGILYSVFKPDMSELAVIGSKSPYLTVYEVKL